MPEKHHSDVDAVRAGVQLGGKKHTMAWLIDERVNKRGTVPSESRFIAA